jgi:hypothetical protein
MLLVVIKNGSVIIEKMNDQEDVILQFVDCDYDGTQSYYLLKVFEKQSQAFNHDGDFQGEELLWSSPIWVYSADGRPETDSSY